MMRIIMIGMLFGVLSACSNSDGASELSAATDSTDIVGKMFDWRETRSDLFAQGMECSKVGTYWCSPKSHPTPAFGDFIWSATEEDLSFDGTGLVMKGRSYDNLAGTNTIAEHAHLQRMKASGKKYLITVTIDFDYMPSKNAFALTIGSQNTGYAGFYAGINCSKKLDGGLLEMFNVPGPINEWRHVTRTFQLRDVDISKCADDPRGEMQPYFTITARSVRFISMSSLIAEQN